jgi:hypothetical protein
VVDEPNRVVPGIKAIFGEPSTQHAVERATESPLDGTGLASTDPDGAVDRYPIVEGPGDGIANPAPSDATDADELLVLRASGNCLHR